jgi:hypothetical protein
VELDELEELDELDEFEVLDVEESFVPLELFAAPESELEGEELLDEPLLEVDADEAERESVMYQPLPLNTMPTG